MRFRVVRDERDNSSVPDRLAEVEPTDPDGATLTRRFRFHRADVHERHGWVVNEEPFRPDFISARQRLGSTEIWEVRWQHSSPYPSPPCPLPGALPQRLDRPVSP
jgi:spore coat protein A